MPAAVITTTPYHTLRMYSLQFTVFTVDCGLRPRIQFSIFCPKVWEPKSAYRLSSSNVVVRVFSEKFINFPPVGSHSRKSVSGSVSPFGEGYST
jgi:hypothetical protein